MFTYAGHVILQLILLQVMQKNILISFLTLYIANSDITVAPSMKSYPQILVSHLYLIFRHMWDIQHILFFQIFIYHWKILYTPHYKWCWFMFTHAGHVTLQLIFYKLCSKAMLYLSNPINCQFWHHSCIWLKELPPNLVAHLYLIFGIKRDIQQFLFFLTISYHWKILYKPHSQYDWVNFTYAEHVILQLILYKICNKCSYKLSNPINCQFWHHSCTKHEELPSNLGSHLYLIFGHMWDIQHILFFQIFIYHWKIVYAPHYKWCWFMFTYAGHVILQLILYKLCRKTSL